jgi:hypothetical protein
MKIIESKKEEYESYKSKNSDPYGNAVVRYGECWMNKMEQEMEERGVNQDEPGTVMRFMVDHAQRISHSSDTEGITGFMYGCAVSALAHFWIHGEQLRRWHNKETQIVDEGDRANESAGVLNPALLCVR